MNVERQITDYFRVKGELTLGDILNKFPALTPAAAQSTIRSMASRGVLRRQARVDEIPIFEFLGVVETARKPKPGKDETKFMFMMRAMLKDAAACNARMMRDGRPRTPAQLAATEIMSRKVIAKRDADIARIVTLMASGPMSYSEIRKASGLSDSQVKDRMSFGVIHGQFVRTGKGNRSRYQAIAGLMT